MLNQQLIKNLLEEVDKSLLLSSEEKIYWKNNSTSLPEAMLEYFFNYLKPRNDLVARCIEKAAAANPHLMEELKQKVKDLKKTILQIREEQDLRSDSSVEKNLEQQLSEIN
jgi:6-pyruvoyl-tetrahydropterin synthase